MPEPLHTATIVHKAVQSIERLDKEGKASAAGTLGSVEEAAVGRQEAL